MLKLVACLLFVASVASSPLFGSSKDDFIAFGRKYNKVYPNEAEFNRRFHIFQKNVATINELNQNSPHTEYHVNQFADQSPSEFAAQRKLPRRPAPKFPASRYGEPRNIKPVSELPDNFDWRNKSAVTPVRDQGTVGTCWAFSAVQNIESLNFLAGNPLEELSVEQLVDCDGSADPASHHADCGVFGGWPYLAFQYLTKVGGLTSENEFPYCVGTGSCYPCAPPGYNDTLCGPYTDYCNKSRTTCQSKLNVVAHVVGWRAITNNETLIPGELFTTGPLSVLIDSTNLQYYSSGIFGPSSGCTTTDLDHAVLIVGWGVSDAGEYWIVKNSWGESWGMKGYFLMARNQGACGVNTAVTTASVITKPTH